MVTTAVACLLGALCGYGILLAVRGTRASVLRPRAPSDRGTRARIEPRILGLAGGAGVIALVVTRWPIAFLLAGAGVIGLEGLKGSGKHSIAKLEAIAVWTEMLRDTLAGASGLTQALVATAPGAPEVLSEPIARLASKLGAGVELETCLRELADDLSDAAGDLVVAALVMACRERAQRLGELLGALSAAIREEVAMRLGIEAQRASSRSAVRMITGFSMGFFALMALFARSYLAPYHGTSGQLALAGVGLLFALGLWMMAAMVRPRPLPRLVLSTTGNGS